MNDVDWKIFKIGDLVLYQDLDSNTNIEFLILDILIKKEPANVSSVLLKALFENQIQNFYLYVNNTKSYANYYKIIS